MGEISREEEELRKLSVELRLLQQTAEAMQQRMNMATATMTDLAYANMTLESIEKEKADAEILVPIGGSSYIKARLTNPDKVIVGIGSGVSVEKTLQEAKAIVKERIDELDKTLASVQQQFVQIAERINADKVRLESLLAKVREGKTASRL